MQMMILPVQGYRDRPVPNQFFRQEQETQQLALVLPGFGYTCDMPLLYFTVNYLADQGADVLQVEYAYNRQPEYRTLSDDERTDWLRADVTAACRAGLAQRAYQHVTLIGKSLGTQAMAHLLLDECGPCQTRTIWFTPLWQEAGVREQLLGARQPALVVIGTADPYYDPATAEAVRAAIRGEVIVIEGADHSLEFPGDVVHSVRALERVMHAVQVFVTP